MMDKHLKNFCWGFDPSKSRNLSLKSWQSICSPKAVGGLGLRPLFMTNQAMVSKLAWLFYTGSRHLWIDVCRAKYMRHSLDSLPASQRNSSWMWQGIVKVSHFVSQAACYQVKNGKAIHLWRDPWIPAMGSFRPLPRSSTTP